MNILNNAKSRIIKNTFFLYILTFSNYFIGLLIYPYLSRVLSIESFGLIGFSMAYVVIFQVIVEYGFMISATSEISKNRNDNKILSEIVSTTMFAKIILAIITIFLFLISAFFVPMIGDNLLIVILFLFSAILAAMLPDFYFRGVENMKTITIRTVAIRTVSLILIMLFVHDDSQIALIPVSFIIGNLLAITISLIVISNMSIRIHKTKLKNALDSIKDSSLFFLSRIAVGINQFFGTLMIGLKYSPTSTEAGLYTGATRISFASETMLAPVSDSLYPHMVNKKDYVLLKKVVLYGGFIWFFICLFVFIFAPEICSVILGRPYEAAGDLLRILIFGNFIAFYSNMLGYNALTPIGKSNHANIAILVGAGYSVTAYGLLWLTNSINLFTVCAVIASTNLVVLGYRSLILWQNRRLMHEK